MSKTIVMLCSEVKNLLADQERVSELESENSWLRKDLEVERRENAELHGKMSLIPGGPFTASKDDLLQRQVSSLQAKLAKFFDVRRDSVYDYLECAVVRDEDEADLPSVTWTSLMADMTRRGTSTELDVKKMINSLIMANGFLTAWQVEFFELLLSGEKIAAIRKLRQLSGVGLKEAKDMVEHLLDKDF